VATDPLENAVETFSAPIEAFIVALGQGIAQAQKALDQNSIQAQQAIDTDPTLAGLGLRATWYQFPRVDLQLRLSLSIAQQPIPPPSLGAPVLSRLRMIVQPVSAAYQNHFNYDAQAASTISLSIVPVPPPGPADQSVVVPNMSQGDVQKTALSSTAKDASGNQIKFRTVTDAQGNIAPDPQLRFDIHFNGVARMWYVLQYDPSKPAAKPAVVAVDDATRTVQVISTP
jgi:hypothetical protein